MSVGLNPWMYVDSIESNIDAQGAYSLKNLNNSSETTFWSTGRTQEVGDYIQFSFLQPVAARTFILDPGTRGNDYPAGLNIFTSNDGIDWTQQIVTIENNKTFSIPSTTYSFIRFELSEVKEKYWSINKLSFDNF